MIPQADSEGPVVIKIGGLAMEHPEQGDALLRSIIDLHRAERRGVVIVHGGGKAISDHLTKLGFEPQSVDGVRITPADQIDHVVDVLAGRINNGIVAKLQVLGQPALGLCLDDGLNAAVDRLLHESVDLGHVGRVTGGDPYLLRTLLAEGYLPVLSPIAFGPSGERLNINADAAAGAVASIIAARLLVLLTDVEGITDENGYVLPVVDDERLESLIEAGVVTGGMVIKARSALQAAQDAGVRTVIASWILPERLGDIAAGEPVGTCIEPSSVAGAVVP